MTLSLSAIRIIKYILSYTGEKEIDHQGNDMLSFRRLGNEESSQRRNFFNSIKDCENETSEELNKILKSHNEKVNIKKKELAEKFPLLDTEKEADFERRINNLLNQDEELVESFVSSRKKSEELNKKIFEIKIDEKTNEMIAKYFKEYGDKVGFCHEDDDVVDELNEIFNV